MTKLPIVIGEKKVNLLEKSALSGNALKRIYVGLDWVIEPGESPMDFDGLAIMLDENRKLVSDNSFVYYGTRGKLSCNGALEISDDNLTGEDDEAPNKYGFRDDEFLVVDSRKIEGKKFVDIVVNLYDAIAKGQTFGDADQAIVRIVDLDSKEELASMTLDTSASNATAVLFGTISLNNGEISWKTKGEQLTGAIGDIVNKYSK